MLGRSDLTSRASKPLSGTPSIGAGSDFLHQVGIGPDRRTLCGMKLSRIPPVEQFILLPVRLKSKNKTQLQKRDCCLPGQNEGM